MVVSSKGEIWTKELTIGKLKKRIDTLEKINGIRGQRNPDVNSINSYEKDSRAPPPNNK